MPISMHVQIAINSEVMVAVCNKNLAQPDDALDIWIRNVNRVGIENAMVVALDDETEKFCQERNMKSIRIPPLVMSVFPNATTWERDAKVGLNHASETSFQQFEQSWQYWV